MILRARGLLPVTGPFVEDGAVVIEDGRIAAVGPWSALRREQRQRPKDLGEVLLLPGLVNAHCHLDYTDMAGLLPAGKPFPDWIKGLVAIKATWSYSEYAGSWLHGAAMLLASGTTTVADIEAVPELLPEVWTATPLRVVSFLELLNIRNWHSAHEIVAEAEAQLRRLPGATGRVGLSPHAPYTTSPELMRAAGAAARRQGWPLTCHVAESREEFDMFTRRHGPLHDWLAPQRGPSPGGPASPVRFLAAQGLLGADLLAVHANYLADGDLNLLADHHVSVVHCPRSHAFFRHQRFALHDLLDRGINVCLGTDSLASVESRRRDRAQLDLFMELRALADQEPELSPETLLRMATVNGAQALGQAPNAGGLCAGAPADLIAIPFRGETGKPYETVLSHHGPVARSMIAGQWVFPPKTAA
jgi:aminodeoxyfutalosine deaminase